ncbi:MAG: ABC transporter, ATP-binding protein [Parcubacteria group bacterium GW2011_GWA2_38_13]|nr:MAG: ABC transporter, ATP-binding protein [Parcubacteria group bacterium GW2011_GWA2_38_13]
MEIAVNNLTKKYGSVTVLDAMNFTVDKGEILGFLGPNGAGKTTTMRILTGFLAPTSGDVKISNLDILDHSLETRQKIGYLPENNPLYNEMKVFEYLEFVARAKGIKNWRDEVKRTLAICKLGERADQVIGELSKGFKQRVGIAQALLGDPEIIIMDEPTSGLDPNQIVEIRNLIKEVGKTKTIILSTHILSEVQASCTRAIIINKGKIVATGTTEDLIRAAHGKSQLFITVSGKKEELETAIQALPGVEAIEYVLAHMPDEARYTITLAENIDVRKEISKLCVEKDVILLGMELKTLSLEDVFRQLTQ